MKKRIKLNASVICAVSVVSLLAPGVALAQGSIDDEPPPRSLAERGEEDDATLHTVRPDALDPSPTRFAWPDIVPSVAISAHLNLTDETVQKPGFGLWLGANYYPWPDDLNAFWSAGLKIETNPNVWGRPTDVFPTLRSGFAWLHGAPHRFKNQLLPNLQVYALTGYRLPLVEDRDPRVRAGIGVNSPRLSPATAMMLFYGVPLPNQVEFVVDMDPIERESWDAMLLIGIGL